MLRGSPCHRDLDRVPAIADPSVIKLVRRGGDVMRNTSGSDR